MPRAAEVERISYIVCDDHAHSKELPGEYADYYRVVRVLHEGEQSGWRNCDLCGQGRSDQKRTAVVLPLDSSPEISVADAMASRLDALEKSLGQLMEFVERIQRIETEVAEIQQVFDQAESKGVESLKTELAELRISQQTLTTLISNLLSTRG